MANNPRLQIEIEAITTNLKKGLTEARAEIKKFNDEASKASKTGFKASIDEERLALAKSRTEAQTARTAITQLALAKKQGQVATVALTGSYKEAQQRLTALGKTIREASGGFSNTTPVIREQIQEYNKLNVKLKEFDSSMGLNHRNIGNYKSALSGLSPALAQLATGAGAAMALGAALQDGYQRIVKFDTGLKNVEKTTGLTRAEVQSLGDEFISLSRKMQTTSATKLTEYATAAGQLGVKGTKNLLDFSEALAKLETA